MPPPSGPTQCSGSVEPARLPLIGLRDAPRGAAAGVQKVDRVLLYTLLVGALVLAIFAIVSFYRMHFLLFLRDWCLDDTFYYLQTAKVFSETGRMSFDGINLTNGFHALWLLFCVPIHWLGLSPEDSTRLLKVLEVLIALGVLVSFTGLFRSVGGFWFLSLPVLVGLVSSQTFLFGLEGGVNALTIALSGLVAIRILSRESQPRSVHMMAIGLVVSSAPLARIENLAFGVLLIGLLAGFGLWKIDWFSRRAALMLIMPFVCVMLLFFAANTIAFDTPFPISGLVKRWWAAGDMQAAAGLGAWFDNFVTLQQVPAVRSGFSYAGFGTVVLIVSWLVPAYRSSGHRRHHLLDVYFVSLALFHAIKTGAYAILSTPFWSGVTWYHLSGSLLKWFVIFYVFIRAAYGLSHVRFRDARTASSAVVSSYVAANLLAVVLIIPGYVQMRGALEEYRRWTTVRAPDWEIASHMGAQWMNDRLPATARVGSWDAGVLAYFTTATVVNLDGVINSFSYFQQLKGGEFEEFLVENGIDYIANLFPMDIADIKEFIQAEARQPSPLRGELALVYLEKQLRVRTDQGRWRSFRVYRYEPPPAGH
jgi:hypothetical protein